MKVIEERTFTIKHAMPSGVTAVVGCGPQLGNFRGYHYRTECGANVCLRNRAEHSAVVSGRFVAMRWTAANADPRRAWTSRESNLFVEVGCDLKSTWLPSGCDPRSIETPEFTESAEWTAASKGGN